jgi:hypothetical protein
MLLLLSFLAALSASAEAAGSFASSEDAFAVKPIAKFASMNGGGYPGFDAAAADDDPFASIGRVTSEGPSYEASGGCINFEAYSRGPAFMRPNYKKAHTLSFAPDEAFTVAVRERLVAVGEMIANVTPGGWTTDRHGSYPTTDFSIQDHFPAAYAAEVRGLAKRWVLPRLAQLGGLRSQDLSISDLFIVKYLYSPDGSSQQHLKPHEDGSTWTFSMGLNSPLECERGGLAASAWPVRPT